VLTRLHEVLASYEPALLLLAAFVGLIAALSTFAVYSRALTSTGAARCAWISLNAITTGLAVWATNFIALIGFDLGVATTYDPTYAAASLLIAIALFPSAPSCCTRTSGRSALSAGFTSAPASRWCRSAACWRCAAPSTSSGASRI
jgi:NO-binding membrane sensor protein with MHYT domain